MTIEEITEIFIKAAEVDRKLPDTARPAKLKSMSIPYVRTTADMNGWDSKDKHAANWAWLDPENLRLTKNDVGIWQVSMELMKLCGNEQQRRALWAWSHAKAGGRSLSQWARKIENITPATAEWRAKAAIRSIHQFFERKPISHSIPLMNDDLSEEPVLGHKVDTVGTWRADDAKPMRQFFDTDLAGMEYAQLRAAKRRERQARKRQVA